MTSETPILYRDMTPEQKLDFRELQKNRMEAAEDIYDARKAAQAIVFGRPDDDKKQNIEDSMMATTLQCGKRWCRYCKKEVFSISKCYSPVPGVEGMYHTSLIDWD